MPLSGNLEAGFTIGAVGGCEPASGEDCRNALRDPSRDAVIRLPVRWAKRATAQVVLCARHGALDLGSMAPVLAGLGAVRAMVA
jgi:hypothetical protein